MTSSYIVMMRYEVFTFHSFDKVSRNISKLCCNWSTYSTEPQLTEIGVHFYNRWGFSFEVCGNKCIHVFPQTFSQEELIFKLWMLWSISIFQSWEKHTCIVLVALVSLHCKLYWLLDSGSTGYNAASSSSSAIQGVLDTWVSPST